MYIGNSCLRNENRYEYFMNLKKKRIYELIRLKKNRFSDLSPSLTIKLTRKGHKLK